MDPRTLDGLSPAELRSLEFEIQARIRRHRAGSENRSPSQPYLLQRVQPQIEPYQFQSIIQDGNLGGIPPRWQEGPGTNFQTQVQPNSRDISSVLSGLNSDSSMHRDIAAVGRGKPPEIQTFMHLCILMCFRSRPGFSAAVRGYNHNSATDKRLCTHFLILRSWRPRPREPTIINFQLSGLAGGSSIAVNRGNARRFSEHTRALPRGKRFDWSIWSDDRFHDSDLPISGIHAIHPSGIPIRGCVWPATDRKASRT
jgi:hypothetical protein